MGRIGYVLLSIVLLALGLYVFWPGSGVYEPTQRLEPGPVPSELQLRGFGYEQQVTDGRVRFLLESEVLERPADATAVSTLWRALGRLPIRPSQWREAIEPGQLPDYGFDQQARVLQAGTRAFHWQGAYLYEAHRARMHHLSERAIDGLDRAARRLDQERLLPVSGAISGLRVHGHDYQLTQRGWQDRTQPQRPAVHARAADLVAILDAVPLRRLTGMAVSTEASISGEVQVGERWLPWRAGSLAQADAWIAIGEQPVQPLSASTAMRLQRAVGDLGREHLVALRPGLSGNPIAACLVERGGQEWFILERAGEEDQIEGSSKWQLNWQGGQVRARADSAWLLLEACNQIEIADFVAEEREQPPTSIAPDAVTLHFPDLNTLPWLHLHADRVVAPYGSARIVDMPPIFDPVDIDRFIDPLAQSCEPERVVRFQRLRHDGPDELYVRIEGGGWRRLVPEPAEPHDSAMAAFLAQVCRLDTEAARLPTAADRELLASSERELDVRLAPISLSAQQDEVPFELTVQQDWGLAMSAQADGSWRAIAKDGGMAYTLSADTVNGLFAALDRRLLLPVVPSLVEGLRIERPIDVSFSLDRIAADSWQLRQEGDAVPADTVAVRRLLQHLAGAPYQVAVDRAPEQLAAIIDLRLRGGIDGDVFWQLRIGEAVAGARLAEVRRGVSIGGLHVLLRCRIDAELLDDLAPPVAHLVEAR